MDEIGRRGLECEHDLRTGKGMISGSDWGQVKKFGKRIIMEDKKNSEKICHVGRDLDGRDR